MTDADADNPMPFWRALLFDGGKRSAASAMGIIIRWAIPLFGVLALGWPAQTFLLAAVINFAWSWVLAGTWNTATLAMTQAHRLAGAVPSSKWLVIVAVGVVVLVLVTCAFGAPLFFLWPMHPVLNAAWWTSLAITLLTPLPNLLEQIHRDVLMDLSEERLDSLANQRRQLLFVGIVPIIGAYGLLAKFPNAAVLIAVAVVYMVFSALCELRPDLAAEFAKELPN